MSTDLVMYESPAMQQALQMVAVVKRMTDDKDCDPERMNAMLAINIQIMQIAAKDAFNSAFSMLQQELPSISRDGEIKIAAKDGRSARVQGRYAKFETINEVVRPILAKYGFSISFRTKVVGPSVVVTGVLRHQQGHSEESEIMLPADQSGGKNSVQAFGSTVSYGKRYMMTALLNITTEGEDDDGAGAAGTVTIDTATGEVLQQKRQRPQSTGTPGLVTTGQLGVLHAKLDSKGVSAEALCKHFELESLDKLPAAKVNDALAFIENAA